MGKCQRDVVETFEKSPTGVVVDVEGVLDRAGTIAGAHGALDQVDVDDAARLCLEQVPKPLHDLVVDLRGEQSGLARVAAKDVTEARRDHGLEASVLQCPHRVLAGGPGAEVRSGDEHRAVVVRLLVEHERGIVAPGGEEAVAESCTGHALEVDGRDDLVGIDIAAAEGDADAGVGGEGIHQISSRSAVELSVPRIAVAAATGTETRWVRPPLPWRPSKLRFEVDALRSWGASWSGFMPRHIEHPAPRHSPPASLKITSSPSSSACSRTRTDPGTTSSRVPSATLRPLTPSAATRRSSMRPFVQAPTKTVSTRMSRIGVPASRPM